MGSENILFKEKYIKIDRVELDGKQVVFDFSCSRRIRKYFTSDRLFIEYDFALDNVPENLLCVPAVSVLVLVAWATGSNLYVEELDRTFLKSLEKAKTVMRKWHPTFSFETKIFVKNQVPNSYSNKEVGLLFSGGLDSVVSYIKNRASKPHLISVWGLDVITNDIVRWKKIQKSLLDFADKEQTPIHFIKSNIRQLLNEPLLSVDFGKSWWVRVSHGLVTTSLCAPLTRSGIGTIIIASTRGPQKLGEERYPLGSSPLVDNKISWANARVVHDCYELNRQQKIRHVLKEFIRSNYPLLLRVCTEPSPDLNCSKCRKCLNTMVGLLLEGINPTDCGFKMNYNTLKTLKQQFLDHNFQVFEHDFVSPSFIWRTDEWKEIQNEIPETITSNIFDSKEFFEWLRDFNLAKYGVEMENKMMYIVLSEVLKYRIMSYLLSISNFLPKQSRQASKMLLNLMSFKKNTANN